MKNSEDIMDIASIVSVGFVFMFVIVSGMILVDGTPSTSLQWLFWLSCGGTLVSTGVFLIALMNDAR